MSHVLRAISSVGGIGYLPRGGATVASFVAGAAWFLVQPGLALQIALIGGAIGFGQACTEHLAKPPASDPQEIVIDEVGGAWLAIAGSSLGVASCAVGVVLFRLLDRLKPWPIRAIDRRSGRLAWIADDIVAGVAANVLATTGFLIYGWLF